MSGHPASARVAPIAVARATVLALLLLGACSSDEITAPRPLAERLIVTEYDPARDTPLQSFFHVRSIALDGSDARDVVDEWSMSAAVSPDGQRLVYLWTGSVEGGLRIVDTDGAARQTLFASPTVDLQWPGWSPDGRVIAANAQTRVGIFPVSGGAPIWITADELVDGPPVWSPDGRRVAFASGSGPGEFHAPRRGIYVAGADGTGLLRIGPGGSGWISWMPDGAHVLVHLDDAWHLVASDGSSAEPVLLPVPAGLGRLDWNTPPIASPDGSRLAFSAGALPTERIPTSFHVYVMRPDGSDLVRVTTTPGRWGNLVWSPDGTRLAFQGPAPTDPNVGDVFVAPIDGSGPVTNVTQQPAGRYIELNAWAPARP